MEEQQSDTYKGRNRREERLEADSRSIEELLPPAMAEVESEDPDIIHDALAVLQYRGNQAVFDTAKRLCGSDNPRERSLGVRILGQNVVAEKNFPEEKFDILFSMLDTETDATVLSEVCFALGHISDPRAIQRVVRFANHPDADVRWGVVHMMTGHEDQTAIDTLIELTADEDEKVRDWATFGIGDIAVLHDIDSQEIREALAARLNDTYRDARLEAIEGLALRKDIRALEPLKKELEDGWNAYCAFEAATALADPSLLPALLELREDKLDEYLEEAIEACGGEPRREEQE